MLGRFCLAELDLRSIKYKIQFTFEVVPCLILGLLDDFSQVCINFSPALQGGGWEAGRGG